MHINIFVLSLCMNDRVTMYVTIPDKHIMYSNNMHALFTFFKSIKILGVGEEINVGSISLCFENAELKTMKQCVHLHTYMHTHTILMKI